MSVTASYRAFILEQLGRVVRDVRARSMFGGVGIYSGPLFFALIDDDTLYLKVDDSNRRDFEARQMGPFRPYGDDGEIMQYYEVPADLLDDPAQLQGWAEKAIAVAARKKTKKGKRALMTPTRAIAYGGLTVAVLDGLDAIVFFGLRSGVGPVRIFKGIAGGLLGREAAMAGGWPTALLGVLLHFTIATTIVAVFVLVSRRLPILTRQPFAWGPLYGIAAYLVMNLVVLPLSALHGTGLPSALPVLLNGILIHIVGVGTPSALFARAAAPRTLEAS